MTKRSSYFSLLAVLFASVLALSSCEDEDNIKRIGNWVYCDASFPGTNRGGAVCFKIGNTAFVGTGVNTNKTEDKERYRDFYSVTVSGNTKTYLNWSARWDRTAEGISSMPEAAPLRNGGVGFSINGKGYVGLGYDGVNYLRDFWEYDPEGTPDPEQYPSMADSLKQKFTKTGKWRRIANYPGDSCRYAVAFTIDNVAYVGTGEDWDSNVLSDFYKFDGKKWTQVASIGQKRAQATAFVMTDPKDGKEYGYVFGGIGDSKAVTFFQRYNPRNNTWEDLNRLADHTRQSFDDEYAGLSSKGCTSFVLNDRAYVTTGGISGYSVGNYTWEYNPEGDYWVQKNSFEGSQRKFAVSFVLENPVYGQVPYVTTGMAQDVGPSGSTGTFFADTWYFHPYEAYEYRDNE